MEPEKRAELEAELAKIEQGIAAQEALRGIVSDEQITVIWVSPIFVLKCPLRNEKSLVKNGYFPFLCGNIC